MRHLCSALAVVILLGACGGAGRSPRPPPVAPPPSAAPAVALRFLEAEGDAWREVSDPARLDRLRAFADNEPARFALALYRVGWEVAGVEDLSEPTLFIALQPGGNHARLGVSARAADGARIDLPKLPYLLLDEDPDVFRTTLLHETGHAVHALVARDAPDPGARAPQTPIPHSTAAITDRRTAFEEGFGIHLETVAAHCGQEPALTAYYQRRETVYGEATRWRAEYYAAARDLMTYAQTFARYHQVRDGAYGFEPATAGAYLRVQLDPARDQRRLRSAGAMMASEGFVASVLFHVAVGRGCARLDELAGRYRPLLAALRASETQPSALDPVPLIEWIAALRAQDPDLGAHAVRAFLDLSHGATIDPAAPALWERLFDAALAVDLDAREAVRVEIEAHRRTWEEAALADPAALTALVGPVIEVEVAAVEVAIAAFGPPRPLRFDLNAADAAMLALVPGVDDDDARAIARDRARAPFADLADFEARAASLGLSPSALVTAASP